jgi:phenylpropionate dioxygenase-like ring-hydroxylating dioxygenase large terminal subunit
MNGEFPSFATDATSIARLVEPDRIHRDVYLSERLFALEQERLFARAWVYAGHASEIPRPGDYLAVEIARQPLIVVRQNDGSIRALLNRCAHKGAMIVGDRTGNTGRAFRCPYHSWAYRTDGSLLAVPNPAGYESTRMRECEAGRGLHAVASAVHRGFVFVRLSAAGPSLIEYFGPALAAVDAMADRSPEGELEVANAPLRNVIACNWKIYLENINDTLHANVTHESAAVAAQAIWDRQPPGTPKPTAMEQLLPFGSGTDFMEKMGGRVFANGHSFLGINQSIHSAYSQVPGYEEAMTKAYGAERAKAILSWAPQNAILWPSIAIKASPQTMRVIRPLGPERTLIEAWTFRAKGAPEAFVERTNLYNRMVFSPMSMVAHDDIHVFESIQRGLRASGNEWVSLHRDYKPSELQPDYTTTGLDEVLMRNQFRAWAHLMTLPEAA